MSNFFHAVGVAAIPWLLTHGIKIVVVIGAAIVASSVLKISIRKVVRRTVPSAHFLSKESERKREDTLIRIFTGALNVSLWLVVLMMVLQEIGIAIGPVLAAAGIAGLAFGFGGQYLIRDLISGFFIILENQYRIGDVVCFGSTCGLVEDISLRLTTLRDMDGTVHHVPHGAITEVANLSKEFSCVNLNVGVSYGANLEEVIAVINRVGTDMAADPTWQNDITTPPAFLRVDDFADSAVVVKIYGKTKPLRQWDVTGELRKRLKVAFDENGIEIPFPQRDVHQR